MRVTISCLVYRSADYAEFISKSIVKYTPRPYRFRMIALDPEEDFAREMAFMGHPTVIRSEREDVEPLDYLKRVYAAYNQAVRWSDEIAVLVQSDNFVSPGWLEGLLEHLTPETIVTSTLIERGKKEGVDEVPGNYGMSGMVERDFGTPLIGFDEEGWLECAARSVDQGAYEHPGPYMPLAVHKRTFLDHGGFPDGNQGDVPGDVFFFDKLAKAGVKHLVSRSSVVYHVGEGEKRRA